MNTEHGATGQNLYLLVCRKLKIGQLEYYIILRYLLQNCLWGKNEYEKDFNHHCYDFYITDIWGKCFNSRY